MSLSIEDLIDIKFTPSARELSLKTLALFYEKYLCHKQFRYAIKHKREEIRLRFKPGDLCHLLGIHHIKKGIEYRGERGFSSLKDGQITIESLKQANIGSYEEMEFRILYFPFVYQLIQNPKILVSDQHSTSIVKAQFIFYDGYDQRYVELKLRQENDDNSNYYVPVTFSALRKVKPQRIIDIKEMTILDYNDGY